MTAFNTAIQALFNDRNLTAEVTFIPLGGESKTMRGIISAPDLYQNVGLSVIETPSLVLEVPVSECPTVSDGDEFIIEAVTYTVQGEPRRDAEHLFWKVDCYAS